MADTKGSRQKLTHKQTHVLRAELAAELEEIKNDKNLCDVSEVKRMETLELTIPNLIDISVGKMSKLAVHVLYDRLSRVCNVGEFQDALTDYAEGCEEEDGDLAESIITNVSEFVDALEGSSTLHPSPEVVQKLIDFVNRIMDVVSVGCTSPRNMKVTPTDFLAIASPFLNRRVVKTSLVLDFLLFRRFFPGVVAYGAEAGDVDLMMKAMDRIDTWVETRPAIARFLDPPCVVVEPTDGGAAAVAGLGASLASCPAVHGQALLPDTISGGGATWNNVISCASRQSAMAVASAIRARHVGPAGGGGGVAGAGQCRVMYFSMTGANHVEC